jgi:uncharacterized protein YifE (UPF0438 family)
MELWSAPEGVNLRETFQLKKLKHTKYNLSRDQQKLLRRQGHKYYQLMDGSISPLSPMQKHFVDMCKGLVEPVNEWEQIWKSYWATIEEEKRLDTIYRAELRQSPQTQGRLNQLWLGDLKTRVTNTSDPVEVAISEDHSRECIACRGSGMKANGDACDRCNGRGWIERR